MPILAPEATGTSPSSKRVVLVADVGGTNARFATVGRTAHELERIEILRCADYPRIDDAISAYVGLHGIESLSHVCLAVAGPVDQDFADLPNNHWSFSRRELAASLRAPLTVINDFTAQALCIDALRPEELIWFGTPRAVEPGIRTVLGPGTGLGIAVQMVNGDVIPSEGGHVGFAPTNEHEIEILRALLPRFRRVSAERLLSGPGLENIFLVNRGLGGGEASASGQMPSAREIAHLAAEGDPMALRSVRDFFDILATFAGDMALFAWSTGGVFLSGGVVRKLAAFLDVERFRARFEDKGRFTGFCERVPVAWIAHEYPGLLGCAVALERDAVALGAAAAASSG